MHEIPRTTLNSWRMLRTAMADKRKWIAHIIRRSSSQVDHWCVAPPTAFDPDASGDINPIDFLLCLLRACGDEQARSVMDWMCQEFGGRFVPTNGGPADGKLFREPADAIPHLKALITEIKKREASDRVVLAHLNEVFLILTSHFKEDKTEKFHGLEHSD